MESFKVIPHKYLITILSAFLYDFQCLDCWHFMLQFFSIAKTLKPIGWTKFSVAWTHVANCGVCCQYLKLFHMVKHNLQISLRLFSKTLNTFSVSKHILHSNAHVIHTGKHKWQQSNTNRENMSLIKHNHSKLISLVSNDVTQPI